VTLLAERRRDHERRARLRVVQVAEETHGGILLRPYPKSRAGVRTVPVPDFLATALRELLGEVGDPDPRTLVFRDRVGRPLRRSNFRRRVWLPSLVRAGLLGQVVNAGPHRFRAMWPDREGVEWSAEFTTEREAVACVAARAVGGMRFHDLRHAYATWLVTDGVPINLVQRVMGHEQASTTLNRYTHPGRLCGPRPGCL
jgi:integrase